MDMYISFYGTLFSSVTLLRFLLQFAGHLPVIEGHGYQVNMSLNGIGVAKVTLNVSTDVEHGSFEWSRQNGEMPTTAVKKAGGSLMIPDVHLEDAGNYSCTARNRSGEVTSEVFEIIIEGETIPWPLLMICCIKEFLALLFSNAYSSATSHSD